MSAYGDLTTFNSGADTLRPMSSPTDATERREATAPYVCLMTLQPSHKLLQLFILLACRTYNFAAIRCFRIYCTFCQNILHSLSECTAQFVRTYCTVYQNILHSLSEHTVWCFITYCTVYHNILHSLSEHTVWCFRTYCTVYQNILCGVSEHTAQFIRTYCTVCHKIPSSISHHTAQCTESHTCRGCT